MTLYYALLSALLVRPCFSASSAPVAAQAERLAELKGPFEFGMNREAITDVVRLRLEKEYEARIANAAEPAVAEKLKRRLAGEVRSFKKSFVDFGVGKSAWDVSVID